MAQTRPVRLHLDEEESALGIYPPIVREKYLNWENISPLHLSNNFRILGLRQKYREL